MRLAQSQDVKMNFSNDSASRSMRPVSISDKTSYRKALEKLKPTTLEVKMLTLLWNLADNSTALLLSCLLNFKLIRKLETLLLCLSHFVRSYVILKLPLNVPLHWYCNSETRSSMERYPSINRYSPITKKPPGCQPPDDFSRKWFFTECGMIHVA